MSLDEVQKRTPQQQPATPNKGDQHKTCWTFRFCGYETTVFTHNRVCKQRDKQGGSNNKKRKTNRNPQPSATSKSFRFHIPPTQRTHRKYASHRHERYCTSINDAAARRASCTALVRSILFHARLRAVRRLHRITSARPHRSNAAPLHTKRAKEENTDKKNESTGREFTKKLKKECSLVWWKADEAIDASIASRASSKCRPGQALNRPDSRRADGRRAGKDREEFQPSDNWARDLIN